MNVKSLSLIFMSILLCTQNGAYSTPIDEDNFTQQLAEAKRIAELKNLTGAVGQNYTYIEGSTKDGIKIIYETASSRTKYKIISPIIRVNSDAIFIDCSYIRAIDNLSGTVSVGAFCRGESEATSDSIEDAVNDQNTIPYSSTASWLKNVNNVIDCKSPSGLIYSDLYFIRCQNGSNDELTDNVTINIMSSNFINIFSANGYEFVPIKGIKKAKKLIFFELNKNSTHKIIEISLPIKNNAVHPSFDCVKASTQIEKTICTDEKLSLLDVTLAYNYESIKSSMKNERLSVDQRTWLKQRNTCTTAECLIDAYTRRIDELCKKYPTQSGTCIRSKEP